MFHDPQVNFYVADIDASVRFYRDLSGFREIFRTPPTGAPIHVEMRVDQGQLTLGLAAIETARQLHGLPAGSGPPRAEVVVWTDDVDRAYAAVTAKGARALSAPHDFIGTLRAAWVADPDGNPIQIVSRVAAS